MVLSWAELLARNWWQAISTATGACQSQLLHLHHRWDHPLQISFIFCSQPPTVASAGLQKAVHNWLPHRVYKHIHISCLHYDSCLKFPQKYKCLVFLLFTWYPCIVHEELKNSTSYLHLLLVALLVLYWARRLLYSRSLLSLTMCKIMQSGIICPTPWPLQAQLTSSLSRGRTWMVHAKKIPL